MTIGNILIQPNISIILVIIVIILIGVYLYLDLRKIKLQIESLDKNNDMFAKEFDKINTGFNVMHKNISHIVAPEELQKSKKKENISEPVQYKEVTNIDPKVNTNINGPKEDTPDNKIYDVKLNPDEEIKDLVSQIDNSVDNITEKTNDPNTIIDDKNNIDVNILDDLDDDLDDEVHDIDLDIDLDINVLDSDDDGSIEGLEGLNGIENQENIFHDINTYLNMSVKELKEKCIELGLKHSGNKHTLAQRIVDKLG